MSRRLQEVLAAVETAAYDAVLFGYGLCNNGLVGLTATSVPLVIPRATTALRSSLAARSGTWSIFSRTRRVLQDQRLDRTGREHAPAQSRLDRYQERHGAVLRRARGQVRRRQRQVPLRAALQHDQEL